MSGLPAKVYVLMSVDCHEDISPVSVYVNRAQADAEAERMNGPPSKRKRGYGFWVDECEMILSSPVPPAHGEP